MSMITSVVGFEGIVMAADSAVSRHMVLDNAPLLLAAVKDEKLKELIFKNPESNFCYTNTASKIHLMKNGIAVSEGGQSQTTRGPIQPYLEYFYQTRDFNTPGEAAQALLEYVSKISPGTGMGFHVCGYDPPDKEFSIPVPRVFFVNCIENTVTFLPKGETGIMQHAANDFIKPFSQQVAINLRFFTLQDMIDFSIFAIKASAMYEKFALLNNRIAGPIDILVIKPGCIEWVSRKELQVEGNQI